MSTLPSKTIPMPPGKASKKPQLRPKQKRKRASDPMPSSNPPAKKVQRTQAHIEDDDVGTASEISVIHRQPKVVNSHLDLLFFLTKYVSGFSNTKSNPSLL